MYVRVVVTLTLCCTVMCIVRSVRCVLKLQQIKYPPNSLQPDQHLQLLVRLWHILPSTWDNIEAVQACWR